LSKAALSTTCCPQSRARKATCGKSTARRRIKSPQLGLAGKIPLLSAPKFVSKEGGFGLFVRSLVGLDRAAAKQALDGFIQGRTLTANQHEFLNMVIEQLTSHGVMDPRLLYEPPFTDLAPLGVEGLFTSADVHELVRVLRDVQERTAA